MAYFDDLILLQQQTQQHIRMNQKHYPKLKKPRPFNPDALVNKRDKSPMLRIC